MSAKSDRYPRQIAAVEIARAALRRGPLIREYRGADPRRSYYSGARSFAPKTVEALIATGEAVRIGTGVVHAEHWRARSLKS